MKRRVMFTVHVVGGAHCIVGKNNRVISGDRAKLWRRLTGAPPIGRYRVTASLSARGSLWISPSVYGRLTGVGEISEEPSPPLVPVYTCWAPRSWHGERINVRIPPLPAPAAI